jgi:hypothetical protein
MMGKKNIRLRVPFVCWGRESVLNLINVATEHGAIHTPCTILRSVAETHILGGRRVLRQSGAISVVCKGGGGMGELVDVRTSCRHTNVLAGGCCTTSLSVYLPSYFLPYFPRCIHGARVAVAFTSAASYHVSHLRARVGCMVAWNERGVTDVWTTLCLAFACEGGRVVMVVVGNKCRVTLCLSCH